MSYLVACNQLHTAVAAHEVHMDTLGLDMRGSFAVHTLHRLRNVWNRRNNKYVYLQ